MATHSVCPSCKGTRFEMSIEVPKGSNYKLNFVRCSSCGTVVGVLEYFDIGTLIHKLADKLDIKL